MAFALYLIDIVNFCVHGIDFMGRELIGNSDTKKTLQKSSVVLTGYDYTPIPVVPAGKGA
jgi:hypothetical protein